MLGRIHHVCCTSEFRPCQLFDMEVSRDTCSEQALSGTEEFIANRLIGQRYLQESGKITRPGDRHIVRKRQAV